MLNSFPFQQRRNLCFPQWTWRYHLAYSRADTFLQITCHVPRGIVCTSPISSTVRQTSLTAFICHSFPFSSMHFYCTDAAVLLAIKMSCGALKEDVHVLILPAPAVSQALSLWCIQLSGFVSFLPGSSSFNWGKGKEISRTEECFLVTRWLLKPSLLLLSKPAQLREPLESD